ncbi:hypothetical protein J6A34_04585 [bacterium]|nr:hypothetical protein [bacterium]
MTSLNVNRITTAARNVTATVAGAIPTVTINGERANKIITWIGKNISSPENRLILGVTALMSQPFIDLHNRKVDEETRKVSAARTVAKIIAGTLTGVLVRKGCIKAIDAFSMLPSQITSKTKWPWLRTLFTPDSAISGVLTDLTHHKNALGTIISLFVMTITNFAIDAPLTKFLTNKFVDKIKEKDAIKAEEAKLKQTTQQIIAQQKPQEVKEVARG